MSHDSNCRTAMAASVRTLFVGWWGHVGVWHRRFCPTSSTAAERRSSSEIRVIIYHNTLGTLAESFDLQHFGGAYDAVNSIFVQEGFAFIHELQQDLEVIGSCPVQNDKKLSMRRCDWRIAEQTLEVRTTGSQDKAMSFEGCT